MSDAQAGLVGGDGRLFGALLLLIIWRADIKYGPDAAAKAALIGLVFLVVLWRLGRGFLYMLFGGKTPMATVGQNTQFQPPSAKKAPPRP